MVQYWWLSAQVVYGLVQEINTQGVRNEMNLSLFTFTVGSNLPSTFNIA